MLTPAIAAAFGLMTLSSVPIGTAAEPAPDPMVEQGFDALQERISGLALAKGQRQGFLSKVDAAESKYAAGAICTAYNQMGAYLAHAQAQRKTLGAVADDLYNQGRALRDSFFDVFIGGPGEAPPSCFDASSSMPPALAMAASDADHFAARIMWGGPTLLTVQAGDQTWTQMLMEGLETASGAPGQPGLPSWQGLVAVPHGATPRIVATASVGETFAANLYPFQEQAADQGAPTDEEESPFPAVFSDPPFAMDRATYAMDAFLPPDPCAFRLLGQARDVILGQVQCTAGQYNPMTDEVRLFDATSFEVVFDGGIDAFVTSQSLSAFEPASASSMATPLNSAVLGKYVLDLDLSRLICIGTELLILTHPSFRDAADDLAQWKNDHGLSAAVIEVGAGTPYVTGAAIDGLIEDRYDGCIVRPSYVDLIGDSEWVPPARTDYDTSPSCGNCGDVTTGSDWGYALYPQFFFDIFPDFGVGRIPADTLAEAQAVVDKIIAYESNPPFVNLGNGGPFYTTAAIASQFQCCRMNQDGSPAGGMAGVDQRSFVETSETVRNALIGTGHTGQRIYTRTTDTGGYCLVNQMPCPAGQVQQAYTGSVTPNRYFDGDLLPAALRSGSGFPWSGSTTDIVNAFNDGRFLAIHRDHGGPSGWSNPGFDTGDLGSLSNGALQPVVYSVNCASGYWDRESDGNGSSESLMERLLTMSGGGMVGGIGDNRNSPTWANSAMLRGFVDATWTNVDPTFGGPTPIVRLGDVLNHGRMYLLTQVGLAQPAGSVSIESAVGNIIMYHAFGDASLEMWTANPHRLTLPTDFVVERTATGYEVGYALEGATITALELTKTGYEPFARATVFEDRASLVGFNPQPDPPGVDKLLFVATFPNAASVLLAAPRGGAPDLVVDNMVLTGSSPDSTPVAPGEDLQDRLLMRVRNLGDAGAPGTIAPDGTLQPGYMVDLVLSRDMAMPFGFATVPAPIGEAWEEDGLLMGGRLSRTANVGAGGAVAYPVGPPVGSDVGGVIPTQAPSGKMFLCARIDPGDAVAESDETNNVFCLEVFVQRTVVG